MIHPLETLRSYAGSWAWEPAVRLARAATLTLLTRINVGQLRVTDVDGQVTVCGSPNPVEGLPQTELLVHKDAFWVRLALFTDMVGGQIKRGYAQFAPKRLTIHVGIRGELHARRGGMY